VAVHRSKRRKPDKADTTLSIANRILKLGPRKQGRGPTRSIDSFFELLAEDQRERAGTVGLEAIKAEGGITFAQDDSAKYDSMPRSAAAAGCVDFVLSPFPIESATHSGVGAPESWKGNFLECLLEPSRTWTCSGLAIIVMSWKSMGIIAPLALAFLISTPLALFPLSITEIE
jgi:hypothetical protein